MWIVIIVTCLTVLLLALGIKFLNWVWFEPKRIERYLRKQGLKGNSYRPFFGDTKELSAMYKESYSTTLGLKDDIVPRLTPFVVKTIRKYGENAFVWNGPEARLIISDPELMKLVLNNYRSFHKIFKRSHKTIRLAIGGLAYFEDEEWHQSRVKLNAAFQLKKLQQMIPLIAACSEDTLKELANKLSNFNSGVVDVIDILDDYAGDVLTRSLFNTPFNVEMRKIFHHLKNLTIMASAASKPFNVPGLWYLPTKRKRRAVAMEKEVRNSITRIINERLLSKKARDINGEDDFLDLCLDELYNDSQNSITKHDHMRRVVEDAIAQLKIFLFAGHATSNTLVWTLIALATYPDWQARAREEVSQIFGTTTSNIEFNHEKLNQLKNVTMILHEVLRLYPSGTEISRIVEKETDLGGKLRVPKGIMLQLQVCILHQNKEIWGKDALDFKPERFVEGVSKATNGHAAAYMPFGWGPRICIGNNFSLMASKICLVQLLRTFSFDLSPTYKHTPWAAFTIQPQHGAPLIFRKLEGNLNVNHTESCFVET